MCHTHGFTGHSYAEIVEVAYAFASRTLLDMIVVECQLLARLRTLKHFFLLDQGDLFVHFMDVAEEELRKEVGVRAYTDCSILLLVHILLLILLPLLSLQSIYVTSKYHIGIHGACVGCSARAHTAAPFLLHAVERSVL